MSKFIIEDGFWDLFPQAEIAVIVAKGIDNTEASAETVREDLSQLLKNANKNAGKFLLKEPISENEVIAVWREAFKKFKTKKGARCSIEALLKRIQKGKEVGKINPLVDLYNAVSLNYGLPCGGEDIQTFAGDMRLTIAEGGERFLALGDEQYDDALPGEVIYKDDEGAVCRCWNWRDGQRTMLTEETTDAFLIIESVDPLRSGDLMAAAQELAQLTNRFLGGSCKIEHMHIANKEIRL